MINFLPNVPEMAILEHCEGIERFQYFSTNNVKYIQTAMQQKLIFILLPLSLPQESSQLLPLPVPSHHLHHAWGLGGWMA